MTSRNQRDTVTSGNQDHTLQDTWDTNTVTSRNEGDGVMSRNQGDAVTSRNRTQNSVNIYQLWSNPANDTAGQIYLKTATILMIYARLHRIIYTNITILKKCNVHSIENILVTTNIWLSLHKVRRQSYVGCVRV